MNTYSEFSDSQQPALNLLKNLRYTYISPADTVIERGGLFANVVLENILLNQMRKINSYEYKGKEHKFSESNIQAALYDLKNVADEGLVRTNERVFDLLTLGKSYEENIQGDKKSFTLKFIDWENIDNNVFHATDEFEVEGLKETCRPDLGLFVNGIPFVVIENKRRDKNFSVEEAVSQQIRNQKKEEGIPKLFYYVQLLLAVHPNEVKYGATGTAAKFCSVWKEKTDIEKTVHRLIIRMNHRKDW